MTVRIIIDDVFAGLAQLEPDSVDCVVTSPPYWGLRDYGVDGQIGLEPTLGEHLDVMVRVFEGVKRVLKPTGTLWLNYGDCYATSPNGRSAADTKAAGGDDRTFRDKPFSTVGPINGKVSDGTRARGSPYPSSAGRRGQTAGAPAGGVLKPKDLCMIPNRLAIALQDAGWWIRSEIIWAKPNPMPESIKDRPATAHEKIFQMAKSPRYDYDADAVRQSRSNDKPMPVVAGHASGPGPHTAIAHNRGDKAVRAPKPSRTPRHAANGHCHKTLHTTPTGEGRNLRNYEPAPLAVWTMPTAGFSEAHFATFPPELAERCIRAGCPEDGVVLDPFGGAGTTALVADRLGRDAILIELNTDYAEMARRRIASDAGLFADMTE